MHASVALFPSSVVSKQHKSPFTRSLIYISRDYHAEIKVVMERKRDGDLSSFSFWMTAELQWNRGDAVQGKLFLIDAAQGLTLPCPLIFPAPFLAVGNEEGFVILF